LRSQAGFQLYDSKDWFKRRPFWWQNGPNGWTTRENYFGSVHFIAVFCRAGHTFGERLRLMFRSLATVDPGAGRSELINLSGENEI